MKEKRGPENTRTQQPLPLQTLRPFIYSASGPRAALPPTRKSGAITQVEDQNPGSYTQKSLLFLGPNGASQAGGAKAHAAAEAGAVSREKG